MGKQTPPWFPNDFDYEILHVLQRAGVTDVAIYHRKTKGGQLRAIASCDPPDYRWHLSIRHEARRKRKRRYPTWEEVADATYELLPDALPTVIYLPPAGVLAANSETILHVWQAYDRELPKREPVKAEPPRLLNSKAAANSEPQI